ncbi:MAG: nucleotidyltransferase family protein [Coriobacteriia bacterium]|nr:nucleotidyltransferase family protein [Coriobacteriia bacterium]
MQVDAVVLSGGEGAVIDPAVSIKGLVPVAGKPMVEWVVEALRAAETIGGIAVVVPSAENLGSWVDKADKIVVSDQRFADNIFAGVDSFRSARRTLVSTGDLPALTPEAIDDFVTRSIEAKADFSYPLIREEDMARQFPGSERTYVRIEGGKVTGGNMGVLSPDLVARNRDIGQRLFETRKSPFAMARVIGFPFIFKLLSGRLRPADVEAKMAQLMGGNCVALYTEHACIGADVDKPIDVVVAERVMFERADGRIRTGNAE